MQQKFLSNFTLLIVLNMLVKLFWVFGIDIAVQNTLGLSVYGDYFALFNYTFILAIIAEAGINNYSNKVIAGEPEKLSYYLANILALKTGLFILFMISLVVFAFILGYSTEQLGLLLVIGINQGLITFYNYLRSNVSALHLFKTESFLSVSDKLVMILICAALLWWNPFNAPFTIYTFAWVQVMGLVAGVLICFAVLWRFIKFTDFKVSRAKIKEILKHSYPYAILITLMSFYTRLDSVMIERILPDGAHEAGIYANGFRLLDSLNMFAVLMSNLLLPMFGRLIHRGQPVNALAKQGLSIMLIPATAVPLLAWFYRHELYQFIYPALYSGYGALVFASVLTAFVPFSMGYIFGTLLTAHGSLKRLNIISTAGLAANFALNLILIPQYKALGACVATVATQSLVIVLTVYNCRQLFGFKLGPKFFIPVLIFCATSVGVFFVLTLVDINWKLELLFALLLMPVLAVVSGLVKVGDLRDSFKSREA